VKLATLKRGGRDGTLVVVSRDLSACLPVPEIAPTLQAALDGWGALEPRLRQAYETLCAGKGWKPEPFDPAACHSPLPRAYQWADGSAYLNHVELARRARGAEMPPDLYTDPLMYQGGSDSFLGPRDPIEALSEDWGIDLEAEIAVVTDDVAMGATEEACGRAVRLLLLVNDVSLRSLIPAELAKGFGFFQSKPATAFGPVAVTPDEAGAAWKDGKLHLPVRVEVNGRPFGHPDAGADMQFTLPRLVAHAAKTRELEAGTIIGSGTVSNRQGGLHGTSVEDGGLGYGCIAELRTHETLRDGAPRTPFLRFGDRVRIEVLGVDGVSLFGAIDQRVAPYRSGG